MHKYGAGKEKIKPRPNISVNGKCNELQSYRMSGKGIEVD